MKVLESTVDKSTNEVWLKVELNRSTDILAKQLFTEDEVKRLNSLAVADFLKRLHMDWEEKVFK